MNTKWVYMRFLISLHNSVQTKLVCGVFCLFRTWRQQVKIDKICLLQPCDLPGLEGKSLCLEGCFVCAGCFVSSATFSCPGDSLNFIFLTFENSLWKAVWHCCSLIRGDTPQGHWKQKQRDFYFIKELDPRHKISNKLSGTAQVGVKGYCAFPHTESEIPNKQYRGKLLRETPYSSEDRWVSWTSK